LRNMKKLARFALAAFFFATFSGFSTAQNIPPIDLFGGYSYFHFSQPSSGLTPYEQLNFNGGEFSVAVAIFHHFSVEGDFAGHSAGTCGNVVNVTCSDFSYMVGPRYTHGDRSSKITFFGHALIGRDQATLLSLQPTGPSPTVDDSSIEVAVGGGADFWIYRHVGFQLGPIDYVFTNHLNNAQGDGQSSFRAAAGIAVRFGGNFPPPEPKAPASESEGHRSWIRPWHKTYPEGQQPAESHPVAKSAPAPAQSTAPSRGMPIHSLGVTAAPQEFDGAKILQIDPGSIAEMASLHVGDLITSVDGKTVKTPMELAAELTGKSGKVHIGLRRGTLVTETVVILGASN
jgi:hypothetical protein